MSDDAPHHAPVGDTARDIRTPPWISGALVDPLVAQSPLGVAVYDSYGRVALGNAAYERHFGIRVSEIPQGYSLFTDEQLAAAGLTPLIRRAYDGEAVVLPPVHYDAARAAEGAGRTVWTQAHCFPVRDDAGTVTHLAIVHVDVSTWARAEASLLDATAVLTEQNELLHDQQQELELANQRLQDQTVELEMQSEELQSGTEELAERTEVAEAAEAMLQTAFAQAPAAIALTVGPNHQFAVANAGFSQLVGREVRTGITFAEALPEIAEQGYVELLDRVYATGEPFVARESHAWVQKGGAEPEEGWYSFVYQPLVDAAGRVTGIMQLGIEVTDQVRARHGVETLNRELQAANAALLASETKYRALFDSLEAGFCILEVLFDEEGRASDYRFLETNPAFVTQTGLVGAVGRTAHELIPSLEPHWVETYGRVARTGEPTRFENGSEAMGRWFDVFAFRVGRPEDRQVALLFTDISTVRNAERERERLLSELEIERSRLSFVFQNAPAFLAVLRGPQYVFELANDAYYQLVGHRDILGKPVWDALPEVRGQGFEALLDSVVATGERFIGREMSFTVARTPGAEAEERFIDLVYLPLVESDGSRVGIIAHGTDVTAQVLARRDVERLLAESERARADADAARREAEAAQLAAESANRAKAEFLATMSHELRTPLNAIGGYTELLELGIRGPITDEQRTDLSRIQQSQRHLLGLVNEVLDLAKVDAGALRVERAAVRIGDTVDAALALVRPQAAAKALTLAETCSGASDRPYLGDEARVRQVLVNLLANAVKFTDSGGRIAVECKLTDTPPPDAALIPGVPYAALRVEDSGRGIPASQLSRIFEPFTQAEGSSPYTRSTSGTGLGLAISRRLARLMGGDLTVDTREGEGSVFTLWLPTVERRSGPRKRVELHDESFARSTTAAQDAEASDEESESLAAPPSSEDGGAAALARVGSMLAAETGAAVRAYVTRLREDADIPRSAPGSDVPFTDAQLEDHAHSFLSDIGIAIRTLSEGRADMAALMRDGTAIRTLIAERHGAQRARLGFTEKAIAREYALLADVLAAAVRRLAGPAAAATAERAQAVVAQLLAQSLRVSLGGFRLAETKAKP